jgi:hypothetical protein
VGGGVSLRRSLRKNIRFEGKGAFVSVQARINLLCADAFKTYDRQVR